MDQTRIDAIRRSTPRHPCGTVKQSTDIHDLLDALESAQATIASLEARLRELERVLRSIADTTLEEDDEEYEMSMDIAYAKLSEIVNDARTIMGRE